MTQNAQITRESVANLAQIVENAVKPLKGKYDRRKNNGRHPKSVANLRVHERRLGNRGPKAHWALNLCVRESKRVYEQFNAIASPEEIYAHCWQKKMIAPLLQMREYVENRMFGKPYVAENPAISKQSAALAQDNRLQVAIQNLVLTPGSKKRSKKSATILQPALQLADNTEPIPAPQSLQPGGDG